ncbi:MAG TPA: family 43 glycosylhydrolase [Acidobacteriaceae bacterium]
MKSFLSTAATSAAALTLLVLVASRPAHALNGDPYIHDPSTVAEDHGKYYVYGTGNGGLVSDDGGWTWHGGVSRTGGGVAADIIHIGDRYYVSYAAGGGGMSGGHASNVHVTWAKTLDPTSPDFGFHDDTVVAHSNGAEDADAIDPSFLYQGGQLWISYGTYFGFIRVLQLDPKTGHALPTSKPVDVAIDMEATALIYKDGWYYLLGTHGTCCDGANSTYNIRAGRARKVTGPYIDKEGDPLLKGGGTLVATSSGRHIGLGHFGRVVSDDDVEKFSCHYEADLDRSGRSVLDIRPLLWKDGWPVGGDNFTPGTYEIESARSGFALELGVDFARMARGGGFGGGGFGGPGGGGPGGAPRPAGAPNAAPGAAGAQRPAGGPGGGGGGGGGGGRNAPGPVSPVPNMELSQADSTWPKGDINLQLRDYMVRPSQKWTIAPVANVGGYLGQPFFKITIAGTDRALATTPDGEVTTVSAFSNAPDQLWQIDQLTDGTYRIMPKVMPHAGEQVVLTAVGDSTPTLAKFDSKSDKSRWNFKQP